jgi:hypothetical protein
VSTTGKPGGILANLPNPIARKVTAQPVVVSEEAEAAFGLAAPKPKGVIPAVQPAPVADAELKPSSRDRIGAPQPERSKTFFLPCDICERLEMQKLSEKREMKHILRQALEEYFERNPLRASVRDLYRD